MFDKITRINLAELGYDEFFDRQWQAWAGQNFLAARVTAEHKQVYQVRSADGAYAAKVTGKQMFNAQQRADYPAVGDWVAIRVLDAENALIQGVLPRKTLLKKKYSAKQDTQIIATNIDVAFIIESLDRDYNLNRLERYLVLAKEGGIKPVIVLNKIDLVPAEELAQRIDGIKNRFDGVDIIATSAIKEYGRDDLRDYIIKGKTYCFLGSSGVGKSSLINKLLNNAVIATREISEFSGRGKHTTTARGMYFLANGGMVIDNPGTREVGVADAGAGIANVFDAIIGLGQACKYVDCTHAHEPGCAVLKALEAGTLDRAQYQNYVKLKKETAFYKMTDREKREKERKFGRFIKQVKSRLKESKS